MTRKILTGLRILLSFAFVLATIFVLCFLVFYLIRTIFSLQKEVSVAIIAAVTTILVSLFSVLLAQHYERKNKIERELRDKKIPIYEGLIDFWFKFSNAVKLADGKLPLKEISTDYNDIISKLIIWGSDDVVSKWSNFRRKLTEMGDNAVPAAILFEFEDFLTTVRKDIGHKNLGMKKGDILGLWVNDINKHL
ncbi:MAG: hypothetical protein PHG97_01085 [Candidatus Margulisbacteria bacterium]|nr:hypothetical protein [Candidatus Margulisiibacteriota bacterium]